MGFDYYNYKIFDSIVLMAMCDANYTFTLVDIGGCGKDNDPGIFNSLFGKAFHKKEIGLPDLIEKGEYTLPYVIVGHDISSLITEWIMKPYPGRNFNEIQQIFNYRLSRARRVIENCFGILY